MFFHFSFFFHHFSPFFTYFFIFSFFSFFHFFSFSFIFLIFFHLGASSRRPRHSFSALMAGVSPGRVPVHTALKKSTLRQACHQPVQETMSTAELPQFLHCLDQPRHLSLHNDRHVNDSVQHQSCSCGISTVSSHTAPRSLPDLHNQHQPPCQGTAKGESQWSLNSETMGSCLCAPTGMLTTLKRNCNCGTSTVMHLWIRA